MSLPLVHAVVALSTMPRAPSGPPTPQEAQLGWQRTAAQRDALPETQLTRVRLDVVHAYSVALNTYNALRPLRDAMCLAQPFSIADYDALPDLAAGLYHTDSVLQIRDAQLQTLPGLLAELTPLRTAFTAYVNLLVLTDQSQTNLLSKLVGANNYQSMVEDMRLLTTFLMANAGAPGTASPFPSAMVDKAAASTRKMAYAMNLRPHSDDSVDALTLDRDRAVTLLVNAYTEVRRVVAFLRYHEDDVTTLVPSLNPQKGHSAKAATEDPPAGPATTTAATAAPAAPTAPAAPAAFNPALEALLAASPQHPVPQNDPFTR